jgi:hypothetical protein
MFYRKKVFQNFRQAVQIDSDDDDVIPATPVEGDGKGGRGRVRKMKKKTYLVRNGPGEGGM